jgi:hypothetical protein
LSKWSGASPRSNLVAAFAASAKVMGNRLNTRPATKQMKMWID